ncbi:MAG: oxidoreductase [Rhodospirillaceae bacterium]|nr:oxidoreductase [Rhodospirillaceae bacterium]
MRLDMGKLVTLPSGESVPSMGLGTWHMGERIGNPKTEVDALIRGLDLGATLIDTAEMYARGGAERVVGSAIKGRRDDVFIVSKVLPHNASFDGTMRACENSLQRMEIECIDLYLLHWPGNHSLESTLSAFEQLKTDGKIKHWGVSNFDTSDMQELYGIPEGKNCQINQVLYNLSRRGIEWDLLPWCRSKGLPIMAYSPIEQGRLLENKKLKALAGEIGVSAAQLSIAWSIRKNDIITIPKASNLEHVCQNIDAWTMKLESAVLDELDKLFEPPVRKKGLDIL